MPSIAQAPPSPPQHGRKRRFDDQNSPDTSIMSLDMQMKLSNRSAPVPPPPRMMQLMMGINSPIAFHHETTNLVDAERLCEYGIERRQIIPKPRRDVKRLRLEEVNSRKSRIVAFGNGNLNAVERDAFLGGKQGGSRTQGKIDLSPCHICHRKPTVRTELDAFADCEGCGRRTCYICIRECAGLGTVKGEVDKDGDYEALAFSFHGDRMDDGEAKRRERESGYDNAASRTWNEGKITEHKGMVCSRCCVEKGTEGEVWCLGCLRTEEAG